MHAKFRAHLGVPQQTRIERSHIYPQSDRSTTCDLYCRLRRRGPEGRGQLANDLLERVATEAQLALENRVHDVQAEGAIALELSLGEPLVGRGLVRKRLLRGRITAHAGALVFGAVNSRLDVEDHSV